MSLRGLHKRHETVNELLELCLQFFIDQFASVVEHAPGPRRHKSAAKPGLRAQCPQHGQPGILRQDRTKAAGRSPDNSSGTIAEYPRSIRWRPRQPVDGILEDARDAVVIFQRDQKQAIAGGNSVLQRRYSLRDACARFNITVVQGYTLDGHDLQTGPGRHELCRSTQQRCIV